MTTSVEQLRQQVEIGKLKDAVASYAVSRAYAQKQLSDTLDKLQALCPDEVFYDGGVVTWFKK